MNIAQLTPQQTDALREISNIGMGHAATALSQLIGQRVNLTVPQLSILELSRVPEAVGGAELVTAGIYLQVLGDARGGILLLFPDGDARRLIARLLAEEVAPNAPFSELAASTLKEVGNILASAFLNALGAMLRMTLIPSVPILAHDMAGAVVDHVLVELGMVGDRSVMIETEFSAAGDRIGGHFFVIPDPNSLDLFLRIAEGSHA